VQRSLVTVSLNGLFLRSASRLHPGGFSPSTACEWLTMGARAQQEAAKAACRSLPSSTWLEFRSRAMRPLDCTVAHHQHRRSAFPWPCLNQVRPPHPTWNQGRDSASIGGK
jgi:hypothetical protein